jgi:hypothetical protein
MTTSSPLRDRLRAALLDARRARDAEAVSVVRSALAALENAEAVPVQEVPVEAAAGALEASPVAGATEAPRRTLTDAEEQAVLDAEIEALAEAERVYAVHAPERAATARRAARTLTALREG